MKSKSKDKGLHANNLHRDNYDFPALVTVCPELSPCLISKDNGELTINFADPDSVMLLNRALLAYFYQVSFWQIPKGYLCPPIPGRADYIHHIADLLTSSLSLSVAKGKQIKALDIGCGANCIYPILGSRIYGWSFLASDIDNVAVKTAKLIVSANKNLSKSISVKHQPNAEHFFSGILKAKDRIAFTMCNPPFHSSMEKASQGSLRKQRNLAKRATLRTENKSNGADTTLNFAGQQHELCCPGGELVFVKKMMQESVQVQEQVCWFTCLISKSEHLGPLKKQLLQLNAQQVKVIEMAQGNKVSRFIAWSYLDSQQQRTFIK